MQTASSRSSGIGVHGRGTKEENMFRATWYYVGTAICGTKDWLFFLIAWIVPLCSSRHESHEGTSAYDPDPEPSRRGQHRSRQHKTWLRKSHDEQTQDDWRRTFSCGRDKKTKNDEGQSMATERGWALSICGWLSHQAANQARVFLTLGPKTRGQQCIINRESIILGLPEAYSVANYLLEGHQGSSPLQGVALWSSIHWLGSLKTVGLILGVLSKVPSYGSTEAWITWFTGYLSFWNISFLYRSVKFTTFWVYCAIIDWYRSEHYGILHYTEVDRY